MTTQAAATVTTTQTEAVLQRGRDWEADTEHQRARSERRAWWVAGVSAGSAVVMAIAIAGLLPLKATIPYVLYVDKTTGNTEIVNALHVRDVGYKELNDKHWAKKYVVARESYLYTLLQYDYDTVLALSSDEVGRPYAKIYEGEQARDKRLGAGTEERIKVISVVLPPDQVGKAVVRFEKTIKRANADQADAPLTFVATMAYEYKPTMRGHEKDLLENPLGFKITSYRVDAEVGTQGEAK